MRITSLSLHGTQGWPDVKLCPISPGLHCYYAPAGFGKSTLANFLAHVLYGKLPFDTRTPGVVQRYLPEGEAIIEAPEGQFRLRRYQDGTPTGRLTIASRDNTAVDEQTVRKLLGGLSPVVMSRLFAIGFDPPPQIGLLLTEDFAHEFRALGGVSAPGDRRLAELAARRDALAHELESRIASERRASHDLDRQSLELDRAIRSLQHEVGDLQQRLRNVEAALAETDARLRYRRLELNTELRWNATESDDWKPLVAELDEQIARWRATLADLAQRESSVRARRAQLQPGEGTNHSTVTDQRAWLAVARQLAMDLEGEVARLARANASAKCVCGDAHPRIRPIVETVQRQLNVLESLVDQQDRSLRAAELADEAEHLNRSQTELRRQLEHLLDRRHALTRASAPSRFVNGDDVTGHGSPDADACFSAADAEQLEQRRLELENERFGLAERLNAREHELRELRMRKSDRDRERAALLSVRSIEHIQRELADIQRKLEFAATGGRELAPLSGSFENPQRASDYLAQLTDGQLVGLQLTEQGRDMLVLNRAGEALRLDSLTASQRDQVYLSLSLALVAANARRGVNLPVVLDDPFTRLDAHEAAALAAVLDHFSRQGHQILVFTSQRDAASRLAALGCRVEDLSSLRHERVARCDAPATINIRTIEPVDQMPPTNPPTSAARPSHDPPSAGSRASTSRPARYNLELASHVGKAPSIGPKSAQHLLNAGIGTVANLLAVDPVEAARQIGSRQIKADTIRTWQCQARLVCEIPQLRAHEARLLAGIGVTSAAQITQLHPEELLARVTNFCNSKAGEKLVHDEQRPDLAQVTQWISRAERRRELHAA